VLDPRAAVVEMVEKGCAALKAHGFPRGVGRADPDTWSRLAQTLYVFLLDSHGRLLLHPDGMLEGRDVSAAQDAAGTYFIREMMQAAAAVRPAGVWTSYLWPVGSSGNLGTKHAYSKMVATPDSGDLIASAGYIATEI